jgi:hypothetical protein
MHPHTLLAISCLAALAAGLAAPAESQTRRRHLALDLRTGEPAARSFGRVGAVLAELRRRDPTCTLDTYEYGGSVACGIRAGERRTAQVLIDFRSVPTRHPEFAEVESVRLAGVNGAELPAAEHAAALERLLGRPGRR